MKPVIIFITSILLVTHCATNHEIKPFEQTRIMMDTFVQISIYDQDKTIEELSSITELAFKQIQNIESITNDYDDSSFISLINREAGERAITLDSVMYNLIVTSNNLNKISDGAFDITIGSVKQLWSFAQENPRIPGDALLRQQLENVGHQNLLLENVTVKFKLPGVRLDLGAIAKGYAVDAAIQVLKDHGISDAMVNAGGNLRAICSDLTTGKRRVWIKNPRKSDTFFGYFRMDEGSVATSGDYERFFVFDSVRYHHILDPKTGNPARGCVSVTIQAASATEADGLSTAVFVLGPDRGMELVNSLPGVEAIIIFEQDGKLVWKASAELKKKFKKIT
jgi:thiamine biosynthesis lipoprotein ApbE